MFKHTRRPHQSVLRRPPRGRGDSSNWEQGNSIRVKNICQLGGTKKKSQRQAGPLSNSTPGSVVCRFPSTPWSVVYLLVLRGLRTPRGLGLGGIPNSNISVNLSHVGKFAFAIISVYFSAGGNFVRYTKRYINFVWVSMGAGDNSDP